MIPQLSLKTKLILAGVALVVLLLVYIGIARPWLQKLGIVTTKEERQCDKMLSRAKQNPAWRSTYYKNYQQSLNLTTTKAESIAKDIKNAFGVFNDSEEQTYGAFKQIANLAQLSYVVERYYSLYKSDLLGDLENSLSKKELHNILVFTETLK